MTITVDELLENSFVISIDELRAVTFYKRFKKARLNTPYPRLFKGYTARTGDYRELSYHQGGPCVNCSRSHYDIVNIGRTFNLPFVCIFEDDAFPVINVRERLDDVLKDLPDDAGVIRLGWSQFYSKPTHDIGSRGLFDNGMSWGSQSQIILRNYYERYAEVFNTVHGLADVSLNSQLKGNESYDSKILRIKNMLFTQASSQATTKNISGTWGDTCFQRFCTNKNDFDFSAEAKCSQLGGLDFNRYLAIKEGNRDVDY